MFLLEENMTNVSYFSNSDYNTLTIYPNRYERCNIIWIHFTEYVKNLKSAILQITKLLCILSKRQRGFKFS